MKIMKFHWLLTSTCLVLLLSSSVFATNGPSPTDNREAIEKEIELEKIQVKADILLQKIQDLKRAKKDAETRAEKIIIKGEAKALKSELNVLEAEAQALSGRGIYIGAGTLLLILILVLLL